MTEDLITNTTPFIAHGALALFGAFTHAAGAYRKNKTRSVVDFTLLLVMSSFSGVMFALLGLYLFGHSSYLTMAFAGTGGFLGVEGMTIVITKIQSLISPK